MIKYRIKDPLFFLQCMKSVSTVIDETIIQFGSMIRSYGVDKGGICIYELIIGENELDIISDGKIEVVVNLFDLQKILNRFKDPDELFIEYDQNRITIQGKINNKTKTFKIAILDEKIPPDPMANLNKLKLDCIFTINISDLVDMVNDASIYNDAFQITSIDNKIVILGQGVMGYSESEYELDEEVLSNEESSYSITLFGKILKELGSQEVIVGFKTNYPIMIYNKLSSSSHLKWYLAPRVV